MKTLTFLASTVLMAAAPSAFAQATDTDTADVAVSGRVAPICILGEPSQASIDLGQMAATSGTRTGRIAALPSQSVTLPGSFCNFAGSMLSVETTALVSSAASVPPSGFARAVNFTATGSGWAGSATTATSNAAGDGASPTSTSSGATQPSPKLADIEVALTNFTVPGDALLLADTYNGLVTVTLGPAAVSE